MNKEKERYYNDYLVKPVDTMRNWLKYKDYHYLIWKGHLSIKELYGIKLQSKHRHRRSIAQRDLHRLFPRLVVRMAYVWLKDDIFPLGYFFSQTQKVMDRRIKGGAE